MFDAANIARKVVSGNFLESFSRKPIPTVFETVQKLKLNEHFTEPVIPEDFSKSIDFENIKPRAGKVSDDAVAQYFEDHFKWVSYKELLNRKAARLHKHSDAWLINIIQGGCSLTSDDRSTWERLADVIKRFAGFRI